MASVVIGVVIDGIDDEVVVLDVVVVEEEPDPLGGKV